MLCKRMGLPFEREQGIAEKFFIDECLKHPVASCFSVRNESPTKY